MLIEERIAALSGPISDCAAAIDAARVMATITGMPHVLYHRITNGVHLWFVRTVYCKAHDNWTLTGGIYEPGEQRSGIGTNPELTPELVEARGLVPYRNLETLKDDYRRFVIGGPARPIDV